MTGTKSSNTADKSSSNKEKIVWLINSVIKKVESNHTGSPSSEMIFAELRDLKRIIEDTRHEIGMARPNDINAKDIPVATDELDAVVEATAEASGKIMDSCDAIQSKAEELSDANGEFILKEVTKIYEACSFQDITGQRIKKVIKTLKSIEERVEKLMSVLGEKANGDQDAPAITGDAALLNGPQLAGQGISQEDIDKLLEGFD